MARTDNLSHFLSDVADAIRTKKGSEDTIQASNFDTEIENLPSGADLDDYFYNDEYLPDNYPIISRIKKFPNLIMDDNTMILADMFSSFEWLEEIEMTFPQNPSTSIDSAINMCGGCFSLTNVIFNGNPDFTGTYDISNMFNGCSALTQLDLSKMHCESLQMADGIFQGCTALEFLDVRNIDFTTLPEHYAVFGYDENDFNPDCVIVVADQTQKDWVETNYSFLTNVKTVAEYEAE